MNDQINPNPEIDGELLSAYLDDELTPSERVRVKQAIENSPPLRELLQELKVISDEIQCLAVEFHPNEQQVLEAVITKIRDRNLSVHGQAPYSNVKIPAMARGWKQRLQVPALLALTAGVLAVLTLQFMPNDQSMTLVQTEMADESLSVESLDRAENNARELESEADGSPAIEDAGAPMSVMGGMGGGSALADKRAMQESQQYRDNANNLAARQSEDAAVDPAAPAQTRASSLPRAQAISEETLRINKSADDKTDVADVTYHIQVKQKDLPTLLALLTAHQNLVQNIQPKEIVGLSGGGEKNLAEASKQRVSPGESTENRVLKSTVNQIVMFRSNASQLATLIAVLQKNPEVALSMNHLQRRAFENRLVTKNKDAPADMKNQSTATKISDTIFSIQVIATP
ncbi:MAG: zf-HC2 domain-containing protein [Planctomycetota bacterium]|nr:zf-HC2 domain-containing protein [Planctomycetota bacterium]